jgi:aspartate 1-decarboxylase
MQRVMPKAKIHRATVTESNLPYVASITISDGPYDEAERRRHTPHVVHVETPENTIQSIGDGASAPLAG